MVSKYEKLEEVFESDIIKEQVEKSGLGRAELAAIDLMIADLEMSGESRYVIDGIGGAIDVAWRAQAAKAVVKGAKAVGRFVAEAAIIEGVTYLIGGFSVQKLSDREVADRLLDFSRQSRLSMEDGISLEELKVAQRMLRTHIG